MPRNARKITVFVLYFKSKLLFTGQPNRRIVFNFARYYYYLVKEAQSMLRAGIYILLTC